MKLMYESFFGLSEPPFSIVPDPRFLFMSEMHQDALAHLLYGIQGHGGVVLITGEVGTGKTTVCKRFIEQLPEQTDLAYLTNPQLSVTEILQAVCDELGIPSPATPTAKQYIDAINRHLLVSYANNRNTVLMIDEAQHLSAEVLEQIRLLTNLETHERKLLQVILVGQPELLDMLSRPELRQFAQRITARFHLSFLKAEEVFGYVGFRTKVAGSPRPLFQDRAIKRVFRVSRGIPRLINLVCDRALLIAYTKNHPVVRVRDVNAAAREVLPLGYAPKRLDALALRFSASVVVVVALLVGLTSVWLSGRPGAPHLLTSPLREVGQVEESSRLTRKTGDSTRPMLNESDETKVSDLTMFLLSPEQAGQIFGQLWNVKGTIRSGKGFCSGYSGKNVRCREATGSLAAFLEYNLPGVLKVVLPDGKKGWLFVRSVEGETLVVENDQGARVSIPGTMISRVWRGQFVVLWPDAPFFSARNRSERNRWVSELLNKVSPGSSETVAGELPPNNKGGLSDEIRAFQRENGLIPDGIAGELTIIRLMQSAGMIPWTLSKLTSEN